ncbi:hypothetical protein METBIDRAFT_79156 [Metschnikowia bicuspidata var. bicuspidata NRRL YB-4993]|uniref:IPT/TIG domain-containing protein n=1 Tax=Metschnikowia bicuspidata var. bicuspidata NRRL YB-4993 TaxID=869754 RepID=A0A1A0H6S7_9ASCO|nr:hypothetical protein METBIDRAFT_79156 [Metschnikowia bicuspidata var. bicuspidata NRRL YB-4993]OBA19799.1 hypothetical protein METBIDRAFT_79156 [Metschnikowia bicuspidata var. bicuspidata NRRL YB-4993]
MALTDDNIATEHPSLLDKDYEDQDILNEFLDQRVFDSLNANTPLGQGQHYQEEDPLDSFHNDVFTKLEATTRARDERVHTRSLDDHDIIRKEFSKVKFGNTFMKPCPETIDVLDSSALDFSPEAMSKLPYLLNVLNLPSSSRVETQIKLKFMMSPPPKETFLHISQDLISKSKFCLQDPVESLPELLQKNMLFVETYVLTSDLSKSCNICSRCIKREQKRALRSKTGTSDSNADSPSSSIHASLRNYQNLWDDEKMIKKAIFFNCKEVISFPAPTGLANDHSKALDFSARIICYCRHHKELEGFKLLFVVRDHNSNIVAKHLSNPIMIMDRKKTSASTIKEGTVVQGASSHSNRVGGPDESNELDKLHPLSPNSIDDSASEALANTDTNNDPSSRGLKRKKLSFDDSYNSSTNPMFNGSGFSPLSNSDTNASIHNLHGKGFAMSNHVTSISSQSFPQSVLLPRQMLLLHLQHAVQTEQQPAIQKIIPAQGPIRGGIEVTLLGFNFRPGLTVKFGSKNTLATHCWSESTIVTYLPPAAQPGQVLVSFVDHDHVMVGNQQLIFTYTDDTDRQLIELALQIVGLKMNGKLEDAKNIAKRIVGSDNTEGGSKIASPLTHASDVNQDSMEWYDNAHKAVQKLSRSDLSTEDILINFLSLVDLPNCPIIIPNWQLCNSQGQSLLHLATLRNYSKLIGFLITHGCKIDIQDNQGLTPLFFASMCGFRDLISVFIECKSNWDLKLTNEKSLKDYCDLNVLDVFNKLEVSNWAASEDLSSGGGSTSESAEDVLIRSGSIDSLNSMYMMNYGRQISRMLTDYSVSQHMNEKSKSSPLSSLRSGAQAMRKTKVLDHYGSDSTDFADSELESEDDFSEDLVKHSSSWTRNVDEEDYYDDYSAGEDNGNSDEDIQSLSSDEGPSRQARHSTIPGLWQMMKTAVFLNDNETTLPSYDDLFPFNNGFMRPKTELERQLNSVEEAEAPSESLYETSDHQPEDLGIASDSSEDMVISYINHPRKAIKNDKMLLFFWLPVLFMIIGLFTYLSLTGYKVELIEKFKEAGRNAIGNIVVGNERLSHVFMKNNILSVA